MKGKVESTREGNGEDTCHKKELQHISFDDDPQSKYVDIAVSEQAKHDKNKLPWVLHFTLKDLMYIRTERTHACYQIVHVIKYGLGFLCLVAGTHVALLA